MLYLRHGGKRQFRHRELIVRIRGNAFHQLGGEQNEFRDPAKRKEFCDILRSIVKMDHSYADKVGSGCDGACFGKTWHRCVWSWNDILEIARLISPRARPSEAERANMVSLASGIVVDR